MASAPDTLVGVTELGDWLGEAIAADSVDAKRALLCLRAASALVRKEAGRTWLDDTGALVSDVPEEAVTVTLYCAGRIFGNREAQTRGGVDEYQEGWKVDEAGAYLTASEKRSLSRFKGSGLRGLMTIATTRGDVGPDPAQRVPTGTPNVEFPWY